MKKIILTALALSLFAVASAAQTRGPSKTSRDYIVKTKQEVTDVEKAPGRENKVTASGGEIKDGFRRARDRG